MDPLKEQKKNELRVKLLFNNKYSIGLVNDSKSKSVSYSVLKNLNKHFYENGIYSLLQKSI